MTDENHTLETTTMIGSNLRRLVGMHGLHQREFASYLGLSPQGLWNILNGRSEPRTSTAQRCAAAFGITIDDLFSETGNCLRAAAAAYERAPIRSYRPGAEPAVVI